MSDLPVGGALPVLVAVSLKMYFSHARTVEWCREVVDVVAGHPAILGRHAELLVLPTFLSIPGALDTLGGLAAVGGQDLSEHDAGPFTGEVSGAELAEIGAVAVEVGHAERRRLYGETESVVRAKTAAAVRNGLTPVLCVGEPLDRGPEAAAEECIRQVEDALAAASPGERTGSIIVAYEPHWAIGAADAAPTAHITSVCEVLREHVRAVRGPASRVIYGGSAGPGLLSRIGASVDGLFLGRFAHDPRALRSILDEVSARQANSRADA